MRLPERLEEPKNIDTKFENSLTKTTLHAHHRVVSARLSYLHAAGYCQLGLPPPPLRRRAIVRRWRRHDGGAHRATRAPRWSPTIMTMMNIATIMASWAPQRHRGRCGSLKFLNPLITYSQKKFLKGILGR